jgi:hypothetical protein
MKIDSRENISRLIGFYPEVVMTTLENRSFLEKTIFVILIPKSQNKKSLSFDYDIHGLVLIKKVEDNQNDYYVFQCKQVGKYPLQINNEKSDGRISTLIKIIITINKAPFFNRKTSFENI